MTTDNSLALFNNSLAVSDSTLQPRHIPLHALLPVALGDWAPVIDHPGFKAVVFVGVSLAFTAAVALPIIALTRLFDKIVDGALNVWAAHPPSNQVVLEAGNLRIEFGCTLEPVPWEFIAWSAASQRDAVQRGFMAVYDKQWWFQKNGTDGARERVCYVGMRVVEEGKVVVPPVKE